MSLYTIVLFLHLAASLALFVAFGIEWTANSFLRRSTSAEEVKAWLRLARMAPPISGPALAVLVLTGGHLGYVSTAMKQGWIAASLLAIAVVFLLGIAVNVPRMKRIRKAVASARGELPAEALAALRDPLLATSMRVRTILGLGIVFLMTAKLPFGQSMLALAIAAVIGFLLAVLAQKK